jgi:hypothetical protein
MKTNSSKSETRKAFSVFTGNQSNAKEADGNVVLFKSHFCIIARSGNKTWHQVRNSAGNAA